MTLTERATDIETQTWMGCYSNGWQQGELVPEAFEHPAKMAKGLVYRIIRYGLEHGFWDKSTTILDCFGGVGTTGLAASSFGLRSVSVELEQRFVDLAQQNFMLHAAARAVLGLPEPVMLQGDSRELGRIVREAIGGAVTSPPYGDVDPRANSESVDLHKQYETYMKQGGGKSFERFEAQQRRHMTGYSVVTSPPFSEPETRDRSPVQDGSVSDAMTRSYTQDRQASDPANIAHLPIGALTSPPYGNRVDDHGVDQAGYEGQAEALGRYGESDGQIVSEIIVKLPEDYWGAVAQVYREVYDLLSPGGVFAVVVKAFVRKKAIVPLPAMTLSLLEDIGFIPLLWVEAMLTEEGLQKSMLTEVPDYQKKRQSFFRRLHERKYPETKIDAEVILFVRK